MNTIIKNALKAEIDRIQKEMNTEFNAYCDLPCNERNENRHRLFVNAWINQKRGIEKAIEIIDSIYSQ